MIQVKQKKCKGTGKAKGYGCSKAKYIHRYGLCKNCFKSWLLSEDGHETLMKAKITGKKRSKTEEKKMTVKRKLESKSIASLIQEARRPFQKLIRIRDHGKNCICCGRPLPFNISDFDGGHLMKAELYTGLIFHPDNVHGQSKHCNKYEHGNENGYREGLKARIGTDRYNSLINSKNALKMHSWSREELNNLKKYYNKELKLVEKGEKNINDVDLTVGIINV